ncbi:MAG: hypothetical protein WKF58_09895 [Ilumatobacteraceae bacterium]
MDVFMVSSGGVESRGDASSSSPQAASESAKIAVAHRAARQRAAEFIASESAIAPR